ncbi:hypothetical protein LRS40_15950 [Leclercia sp. G3L]|uniref:hypothetical protein n=1 Tax=Leclercia sp. G3L TaxID=2898725 RepID=UPI001E28F628|nr:hypothetical protein [Leclercia sp. G3L]UGB01181.1 hypothetical protein LRS40_15950 [Leclercia sp. G3L]
MTTNKLMTGEQLDELMIVAVRMQRDAEVVRNFPSANFAYAVQVAVLELLGTRAVASALSSENAALKKYSSALRISWPALKAAATGARGVKRLKTRCGLLKQSDALSQRGWPYFARKRKSARCSSTSSATITSFRN